MTSASFVGSATGWHLQRVKRLASRIGSGKTPSGGSSAYVDSGVMFLRSQNVYDEGLRLEDVVYIDDFTDREMAATRVCGGDVLLNITGASIGRCAVAPARLPRANVNQHVCIVRPRAGVFPDYLAYSLKSYVTKAQILAGENGSSREGLNFQQVGNLLVLLPPGGFQQQRVIAAFLDRRTAAIDALIETKERLVAAAEERRAALISDVVLGALSNAKRRGTGTPLGPLPEHWTAKRLMYLTQPSRPIMYGIVLPGPNVDAGVPIIKSGNCTRETLRPELLHKTTFEIEAGYARSRVAEHDIVYAIRGSVGMVALVPKDIAGANLTQDAARIAPGPNINPRWLLYAVQSAPVWVQLAAGIVGATVKGINIRDLKRPFMPVPPRREQNEIAEHLDAEIGKLHDLESSTARSIDRLREYRQAIITAAVTGQLDIAAQEAA